MNGRLRAALLIALAIVPGICGVAICGHYALVDWAELQQAYAQFRATGREGDLRELTYAAAVQNVHRINLFADGVWALLSAILAAIGLHGLPVRRDGE